MQRQDFTERAKGELARRAGYKCSMPTCGAPTSGPSESSATGTSSVGVAAHISAASVGGPRYDPSLRPDQRESRDNGIWLCQTHAKVIDDDPGRYTTELLLAWRETAEERAREEQGRPMLSESGGSRRLVPFQRELSGERRTISESVERFLIDIGAPNSWGAHFDLARMVIYELAINALEHGGAPTVTLQSRPGIVTLRDRGKTFGLKDLRSGGQGGRQAISDLATEASGSFSLVYREDDDQNEWSLIDQILADGANTPCSLLLLGPGPSEVANAIRQLESLAGCHEVHLYPGRLWSYSDYYPVMVALRQHLNDRTLVIHGVRAESPVGKWLLGIAPETLLPD